MPAYYNAVSNRRRAGSYGDGGDGAAPVLLSYRTPPAPPGLVIGAAEQAAFAPTLVYDAQHASTTPARIAGGPGSPGLVPGPPGFYDAPADAPPPIIVGDRGGNSCR